MTATRGVRGSTPDSVRESLENAGRRARAEASQGIFGGRSLARASISSSVSHESEEGSTVKSPKCGKQRYLTPLAELDRHLLGLGVCSLQEPSGFFTVSSLISFSRHKGLSVVFLPSRRQSMFSWSVTP